MRMQRNYKNGFEFERIYPPVPNEGPIPMLMKPKYTLKYNKDGYVDYSYVHERAVVYQKRIWRMLYVKNNPMISGNKMFDLFYKQILNKNISNFNVTANNEMEKDTSVEDFRRKIQPNQLRIIGYKIKEDFFFDWDRMISETRIISMCPVAFNINSKDTADLFWVYFPQVRKYLANEKVVCKEYPDEVKTLDDVFFFRCFNAEIYKESNVYDRPISAYFGKDTLSCRHEAERIEKDMINEEHDLWIGFTKKPN